MKYKDKFGNFISKETLESLLKDKSYTIVAKHNIGNFHISTIWLGKPDEDGNCFETCVFQIAPKPLLVPLDRVKYTKRHDTLLKSTCEHQKCLDSYLGQIPEDEQRYHNK